MFVDQVRIFAQAGKGGTGSASFRREKFIPKGGPDGGDGGRGGSIIFQTDPNVDALATFYYEPILRAKPGGRGSSKNCTGRSAADKIIKVPIGTLIYRLPAELGMAQPITYDALGEEMPRVKRKIDPKELELVVDLDREGLNFTLCKGGKGGRGNTNFKSARNRVPRQFTDGEEGEEGYFFLELRKIADAGLVGYPNAGKSTLLGKLSAAQPKVAPYPFTTLHPLVGVLEFPGYRRVTVADIPGLIEGAHRNVGLGHDFLRHIVRCRLLLMVVDMAGSEGRNPTDDFGKLRTELKLYDPSLPDRPFLVIANKMDLPDAKENLKAFKRKFRKLQVVPISAQDEQGLAELRRHLETAVLSAPVEQVES